MQILIIAGFVSLFIFLYIGTMYLNDRVKVPESCKEAYLEAQSCETCNRVSDPKSCTFKNTLEFLKEVKL